MGTVIRFIDAVMWLGTLILTIATIRLILFTLRTVATRFYRVAMLTFFVAGYMALLWLTHSTGTLIETLFLQLQYEAFAMTQGAPWALLGLYIVFVILMGLWVATEVKMSRWDRKLLPDLKNRYHFSPR